MRYLTIVAMIIAAIAVISGSPTDAHNRAVEDPSRAVQGGPSSRDERKTIREEHKADQQLGDGELGADVNALDTEVDENS